MRRVCLAFIISFAACWAAPAQDIEERASLARHFEAAGTKGTIVIRDVAAGTTIGHDAERARTRYLPASTFKVPAALIALETGVVKDAREDVFPWDGVEWKYVPACNADQTLASALARSCVPVFAKLGQSIGAERLNAYLAAFDYGNQDASGAYPYWLEGNLRISALEQVDFLDRLRRDVLPASHVSMQAVRDMVVLGEGKGYVLRGKTGWDMQSEPNIGWLVGWVERGERAYVFALNIDIATSEHGVARIKIVKAALREMGGLP